MLFHTGTKQASGQHPCNFRDTFESHNLLRGSYIHSRIVHFHIASFYILAVVWRVNARAKRGNGTPKHSILRQNLLQRYAFFIYEQNFLKKKCIVRDFFYLFLHFYGKIPVILLSEALECGRQELKPNVYEYGNWHYLPEYNALLLFNNVRAYE